MVPGPMAIKTQGRQCPDGCYLGGPSTEESLAVAQQPHATALDVWPLGVLHNSWTDCQLGRTGLLVCHA